eukprot:g6059.t1
MADLAFAAEAAEDNYALETIAQTQTTIINHNTANTAPNLEQSDWLNDSNVDDLDVAASAANASSFVFPYQPDPHLEDRPKCTMDDIMMDEAALLSNSDDEMEEGSIHSSPVHQTESGSGPSGQSEKISVFFSFPEQEATCEKSVIVNLSIENKVPVLNDTDQMEIEEQHEPSVEQEHLCSEFGDIVLGSDDELKPVGTIRSKVDGHLVIQAESLTRPLETGSILFGVDGVLIGKVIEIFGTVQEPLYVATITKDLADNTQLPGTKVCHTHRYTQYIDLDFKDLNSKNTSSSSSEEEDSDENRTSVTGQFATVRSSRQMSSRTRPRKRGPRHQVHFHNARQDRRRPQQTHYTAPNPPPVAPVYAQQHVGFHPYFPPNPSLIPGPPPGASPVASRGYVFTPVPMMVYQPYGVYLNPAENPQRHQCEYRTDIEIKTSSPNRAEGISLEKERRLQRCCHKLIESVGTKRYGFPSYMTATAHYLVTLFYSERSYIANDFFCISTAALSLAGKFENRPRSLDYIISAMFETRYAKDKTAIGLFHQDEVYRSQVKQSILHGEELILELVGHDFQIEQPYSHLFRILAALGIKLKDKKVKLLVHRFWHMVNVSCKTTLWLQFSGRKLAVAVFILSARYTTGRILDMKILREYYQQDSGAVDLESELKTIWTQLLSEYDPNSRIHLCARDLFR